MSSYAPTVLSPKDRAMLAADENVGGGNLLASAIAVNPSPDVPFLHSLRPVTDTDGSLRDEFSLFDLDRLAQAWAAFYAAHGVGPRDRVAVYIEDSVLYSIQFYALAQLGAIAVLINSNASRQIARSLLRQTEPVGIYVDTELLVRIGNGADELAGMNFVQIAECQPGPPEARLPPSARFRHHADDPVVIMHSSGTTGTPKPTIHTHRSIVAGPQFRLVDHEERPGAVMMTSLPQSHLGCIAYTVHAVLAGATTIAGFDRPGGSLVRAVSERRPTSVMSFAHAYSEIADMDPAPGALDSVDTWVSIGDAVHEAHIRHVLRNRSAALPPARFLDRLGTTELGWGVLLRVQDLDTVRNDRCAGKPVGVAEVTILRADGTHADTGEIGLLAAKGPAITPGYWGNSDLSYRSRLGAYWLTGDNAYRDADGDYFVVDRTADAIDTRRGTGYSVFMEEAVLNEVPDIVDCAIVAGRDADAAVAVAVVTVGAAVTEAGKLLRQVNEALDAASQPAVDMLHIARTEEDMPIGVTGKVLKRELRERYTDIRTHTGPDIALLPTLEH